MSANKCGQEARQYGHDREDQALHAFKSALDLPPWFSGIEKASIEQDQRGIDLVVRTNDKGNYFIQVKSSSAGARKYRRDRPQQSKWVAIIVISPEDSPEKIRKMVLDAVVKKRATRL